MNRKLTAAGLAVAMSVSAFSSAAFAMEGMDDMKGPGLERLFEAYDLTKPEGWDDYSKEEREQFFIDNGVDLEMEMEMENEHMEMSAQAKIKLEVALKAKGVEIPEDWRSYSKEEKQAFLEEHNIDIKEFVMDRLDDRRPEAQEPFEKFFEENDIEKPENWDSMTREEKKAFLEENGFDFDREMLKDKIMSNEHSRKGARFVKLSKLVEKVNEFLDKNDISREEAVAYLQEHGVINGYGDGSFKPKNGISRAEAIKIVLEAIGEGPENVVESDFSDVEVGAWYKGYIQKAKNKGYVEGYADGTFKPNQTVNKVELMKIAFEIMGVDVSDYSVEDLPADADVDAWYAAYLAYAVDTGLIDVSGEDEVKPGESMTREEFSEFVYRLLLQQESL